MNSARAQLRKSLFLRLIIGGVCLLLLYAAIRHAVQFHRIYRSRIELADHQPTKAIDWLIAAQDSAPDSAEVQFLLARAYRKLGQLELTRKHLKAAAKLDFSRDRLELEQTMALAQSGQLSESEQVLKARLPQAGPDAEEICEALVNGYLRNYQFASASRLLRAWEADFPNSPQPRYCRGLIWQQQLLNADAAKEFQAVLRLAPDRNDARLALADCLRYLHRYDEALGHYEKCLARDPDNVAIMTSEAFCLMNQGKPKKAKDLFLEAERRDANNIQAQLGLAKLALAENRSDEVIRRLGPLVDEYPRSHDMRNTLATALRIAGDVDRANAHFEYVRRANEAMGRVRALTEQLTEQPELVPVRFEIATLLMEYGSRAEAAAWLHSVLQFEPDNRDAHRMLADYYEQLAQDELASRHRRFAQSGAGDDSESADDT